MHWQESLILDKHLALADGKTTDLNGDGAITVDDDLFSLICWNDYPTAMLYGAGGDFSEYDGEGNAILNINTENPLIFTTRSTRR